ncbi:Microsomal glutathione S-transferase 1 [Holothuria leucospilota]|uniref:Microsomal glutathione S-transferase 1 n=1 Tax=Holothuria leucospilota TaxID=206669 RepID=A0A9Q1C7F5_HOLLE|nr:Microsomal glutathione S-transferase 1 [Holothuria leucospilota]
MDTDLKDLFSLKNDVFRVYLTYAILLVFKMMFLSFYTSIMRGTFGVYMEANREDAKLWAMFPEESSKDKLRIQRVRDRVDRIRRCHLNDLENIPAFLIVGLLFVAINPPLYVASIYYRVFTAARYIHCVAYLLPLPQPCRAVAFGSGSVITVLMGVEILKAAALF